MFSGNGSGFGLSDLSKGDVPPVRRRLEMNSDSSGGMNHDALAPMEKMNFAPFGAGVFTSTPLQRFNFQGGADEGAKPEMIKVMNSVCTREQLQQSREDFVYLAIKARDFETWMLPPEVLKDPFF